jgi:hypothetical protein
MPEVEEDASVIREVLVRLGEDNKAHRPLPSRRCLLVDRRLVDLGFERVCPLRAVRVDDVGVCHCSAS